MVFKKLSSRRAVFLPHEKEKRGPDIPSGSRFLLTQKGTVPYALARPAFFQTSFLAALSGNKTVAGLSTEYGVHQTQINRWVKQLKDNASEVFSNGCQPAECRLEKDLQKLHAKIGQFIIERKWDHLRFNAKDERDSGTSFPIIIHPSGQNPGT